MKKLMIAAAIVCAAVMSQAATINWGVTTEAPGVEGGWANEGAWYGFYMLSEQVANSAITAIDATTHALTIAGGVEATLLDEHTLDFDEYDSGTFGEEYKGAAADLNGKYYAIVLVDPSSPDNASAGIYSISGLSDVGNTAAFSIDGDGEGQTMFSRTGAEGSFSVAVETVPEPTSGLLLLIGVAGLALKRRRA